MKPTIDTRDLQFIIDKECSKLCSKNRTVFRTVSTTEFARFNFDVYERELKEIAPTLWTVLEAAATSLNTTIRENQHLQVVVQSVSLRQLSY